MATVPRNAVAQQFSHVHPTHALMHHSDDGDYTCHGCNTSGSGPRFRCHVCTIDVHVYCSDCPQELSSFLHPHRLALVPRVNHRCCDVCRESIDGMSYRCDRCDFDAHPLCTQFPEQLRHVIDHLHKLRLRKLPSSACCCSVCEIDSSSLWVYGCDDCGVNIHPKCILKPYGEKPAVETPGSRGIPYGHPPPWTAAQPPQFHGGAGAYGPYGHYNVRPNDFGGYGYGNGYGGGHSPWAVPNYYTSYPQPPRPIYGGHTPPPSPSPPSPSIWGTVFGGTMFALVESLAVGSFTEFIFGSMGF